MTKDHAYLYLGSVSEARRQNELALWRASHLENIACKQAIEEAIRRGFDGMHLSHDCARGVIEDFGFKRVGWVLAATLQQKQYDGRFSPQKRIVLIAVCCLLCVAAAIGIAVRFGGNAEISSGVVSDDPTQSGDPNVDIDNNGQTDLEVQVETPDASETDPAQGADSSGLEQSIQADPVKPESPEKPEAPAGTTTLPDDHDGADVPEEERKTEDEAPPTYEETPTVTPTETEPAAGSTNSSGQVYVPGFGYVENSGENQGGTLDDMYENGNKIGIMGGE